MYFCTQTDTTAGQEVAIKTIGQEVISNGINEQETAPAVTNRPMVSLHDVHLDFSIVKFGKWIP